MDTNTTVDLSGLWVPIVTPFANDGSVDLASLERLGVRLLADGADGLVALGTTGEPATLSQAERRTVVEVCDSVCREHDARLMIGTGTNSTQATIDETEFLTTGTSAAAALVVVPYYTRPSPQAVVEHLHLVADGSPTPVVIYNVPYRTGLGLDSESVLATAEHSNIVGLKQSVAMLDTHTLNVLRSCGDDFAVLAGDDAFIGPTILMGGRGAISAAAHLCTAAFAELVAASLGGNAARSAELTHRLLPVVQAGFAEPNPTVFKGALSRSGDISTGAVRRPLTPASASSVDSLLEAVAVAEN